MTERSYDTVVVGGGIAGLTATVYLARAGQKVLLIEKNRELGGLVNSFTRNGFHFDAGVRALEDAGIILPMLKDLNIDLPVVKSEVSVGIEKEILRIESVESLTEYSDMLKRLYPGNEGEVDAVIKTIRKIMKQMDVLYGVENPLFKDLKRDTAFIFRKLLPWMPRFLLAVGKINKMSLPVEEYLSSVITNRSLNDIISQHFFKNTPTFFALSYFSLYLDYFYPTGGVGRLSQVLEKKIAELGGDIKRGTTVTALSPAEKTVTDNNGDTWHYNNLIWAADLKSLYNITDTGTLADDVKVRVEDVRKKIMSSRGGESVFTLFLEVDEPLESFAAIASGHFFYTPSRQGLGETHRRELAELIDNFDNSSKEQVLGWLERFVSLNTFEISIPGLKDRTLVPPGRTGMIISLLSDYTLFKKVEEAGWLDEFVQEMESRMLRVIADSVYPMLREKVINHFSFTPLSYERRINSSGGAIVGWEFQKEMPVVSKIQIADRSVVTPLPSVYQAGQWVYSPAGVPMSILTGKLASKRV